MRSCNESIHSNHDSVLEEIGNCSIFFIEKFDDEEISDIEEFVVSNPSCEEDPLILTRSELRRLGEEIIKFSDI